MNQSPARELAERFAALGPAAHKALDLVLDDVDVIELAALAHDWVGTWARPNQLFDVSQPWRSHGFLAGRRFGKSKANAEFVIGEMMSGRAMRVGFCAQNAEKTIEVMVEDPEVGLVGASPPWFRGKFEKGRVVFPNGAMAFPFTPEVPGSFRGPGFHLFWASELQSWPATTREESFSNAGLMTSLGYARFVWDATPKRRHPILRMLLARSAKNPALHPIVTGVIEENADNLGAGIVAELRDQITGQRAKEELDGIFLEDSDDALWRQEWIDKARRDRPSELTRRVLALDPATSDRKGTDETGFVEEGLGSDGQVYVIADYSKRYAWEEWGKQVLDIYFRNKCDCVVIERNAGGDAVVANLRACGRDRGVNVILLEKEAITQHTAGTLYVKEVFSRSSKESRAEPVASFYERGRVSHVRGVDLLTLEDELTTWVPEAGMRSPNRLDALVFGVHELAKLGEADQADPVSAYEGFEEAQRNMPRPAMYEAPKRPQEKYGVGYGGEYLGEYPPDPGDEHNRV